MSQSFFKYETDAERYERLKQLRFELLKKELRNARRFVNRLKDTLDDNVGKDIKALETGFSFSDSIIDDIMEDDIYDYNSFDESKKSISDGDHISKFESNGKTRERINLSGYLEEDKRFEDETSIRLKEIIERVTDRVPDSDKARSEYDRLMDNINKIMTNKSYSSEEIVSKIGRASCRERV